MSMIPLDSVSKFLPVLPSSEKLPAPPAFNFGTWPGDVAAAFYKARHLHGIGVFAGTRLALGKRFILDRDRTPLVGGSVAIHPGAVEQMDAQTAHWLKTAECRRIAGKIANIIQPGFAHVIYGHWLADILPRLAVLKEAGYDLEALTYPVPRDTPQFGIDLLTLLGVAKDRLLIWDEDALLEPDELLVPTTLHNGVRASALFRNAVDLFKQNLLLRNALLPPNPAESRLFVARKSPNRVMLNRRPIEEMARAAGFSIVYPEERSLPEQFALFASAREIISEYGSALHTTLFSPAGTVVCALRGSQIHPAFIQSGFGDVLGQPTGYVFGTTVVRPGSHDFTIEEEAFSDCLKLVFSGGSQLSRAYSAPPLRAVAAGTTKRRNSWLRELWQSRKRFFRPDSKQQAQSGISKALVPVRLTGHIQNIGDTQEGPDGWLGEAGCRRAIEGFSVHLAPHPQSPTMSYRAIGPDGAMSQPVPAGVFCGTSGKNTPLFGLCIEIAAPFAVTCEARFVDGTRIGPVPGGTVCQAASKAALEAFRLEVFYEKRKEGLLF